MIKANLRESLPASEPPSFWFKASCALLALLSAIFFQYAIPIGCRLIYTIGFIPLLVGGGSFLLYAKSLPVAIDRASHRKREAVLTALLALLLSSFLIFGAYTTSSASIPFGSIRVYCSIIANGLPIYALLALLWDKLDRAEMAREDDDRREFRLSNRSFCFVSFLVLFVAWLPVFLASYPGFYCYDVGSGGINLWEQYSTGELNSHHPVAHTLLVGSIISAIAEATDFNTGVAVYTCLQALGIAVALTAVLYWMKKNGSSVKLCIVALLYCALNPVVSMFAMCATKDVLFSTFVVLLCVIAYDSAACLRKNRLRTAILLAVVGTLVCIFRSNGLVAFILFCPVLVLCARGSGRLWAAAPCAVVLIASLVWLGPVSEAMHVKESDAHRLDGLALPVQQLASVCESGSLSGEERELLESLHYNDLESYFPTLADPSRYTLKDMSIEEIARAYITIGLNHPDQYTEAFLLQTQAAWNPYTYVKAYNGYADYYSRHETSFFGCHAEGPAKSDSKIPGLLESLKSISLELDFQKLPFLALLVLIPFYFWLYLICAVRVLSVGDRRMMPGVILLGLLSVSVFLAPCVLARYFLFLIFGLPVVLFFLLKAGSDNGEKVARG